MIKRFWKQRKIEEPVIAASPSTRVLILPRAALNETHAFFLPYWRAGVETACFWFGVEAGDRQVVTTVAMPRLHQSQGHYRVERDSLRRLAETMRAQGLINLAQVHTHPGLWVGHSPYDDDNAYSTRTGALSFVWPEYGRSLLHTLAGIGVHERYEGAWRQLDQESIERRVHLVDSRADVRWEILTEKGERDA